jgi:hypothetical protein
MPMRVRVEMLTRVAEAKSFFPPYRVTVFHPRSTLVKAVFYVCGRCSLKEKDNPTGRAEQRDERVPPNAYCTYCDHRAVPWAG